MWEHYQKVVSAYKRKDARAFAALFSPDFKAKMWDGKTVDRQALEEWARQDMAETKALYSQLESSSTRRQYGDRKRRTRAQRSETTSLPTCGGSIRKSTDQAIRG